MTRFKPTRAGIINLWNYVDEEFVFGDGRLALRGHNGSGKTKALEVLFPFVLDGSLSSRRLDPFSGENRTMKSNLLYRGQDAEYGYVWMEFARDTDPLQVVTLVIGLSAHKNRDDVAVSYYVTGKRIGVDFGLLSTDSRPLTAKQLAVKLGPRSCFKDSRAAYRHAADDHLFGLGPERYAQLLDLLLSLRRPLLAKDLDPAKVSDTLSAGLSPVDEDLVEQAARDFDNLAAVQRRHEDLVATKGAVETFLAQYTGYVKVHTKWQLERLSGRISEAAGHASAVRDAAREVTRATKAELSARQSAQAARTREEVLSARRGVLTDSEDYKSFGRLLQERASVAQLESSLGQERDRLAKDRRNNDALITETDGLQHYIDSINSACARQERELLESAADAGLIRDGAHLDPAAEDLATHVNALTATRRDDIRAVRTEHGRVAAAQSERFRADTVLGDARVKAGQREKDVGDANTQLEGAKAELAAALGQWTHEWSAVAVLVEGLADALLEAAAEIGAADSPDIAHVFTAATGARRDALIAEREQLRAELGALSSETGKIRQERERIATQRDEAPPETDLRTADRTGRPGAPLWQLVRFADHVPAEEAAALEGALYGSGSLTAWLHPLSSDTLDALDHAEPDGYLLPLSEADRPTGLTLADYLEPEEQDLVSATVIRAVLASVAVADDPRTNGGAQPWISTGAQYGQGIQVGARPKSTPEYIGATNRATRRASRLAELDALLVELADKQRHSESLLNSANDLIESISLAGAALPSPRTVEEAISTLKTATVRLADAETHVREASKNLDTAVGELATRQRRLRQVAGERAMPTAEADVDSVAEAVDAVAQAADKLVAARRDLPRLEKDLGARRTRINELEQDYVEAAEKLSTLEDHVQAAQAALQEAERSVDKGYTQIATEIGTIDEELATVRRALVSANSTAGTEHDNRVGATRDLDNHRATLRSALGTLRESADEFEPYAHADLRTILGVSLTGLWPSSTQWATVDECVDQIAEHLNQNGEPSDSATAIHATFPADATTLLGAYREVVRSGRAVTSATLDNANNALTTAYQEFERVLRNVEDGYEVSLGLGTPAMVEITADDGRQPVGSFARRITEEAQTQGTLLEEREREVLEDSLLTALAQQIHHRVLAAKDLVKEMDADTRAKPMSSGISIGINWVRSDKATEQQIAVATQLQRSATALGQDGLAQLRGRLREMIREHRARNPRDTFRETLANVLDYRSWYMFTIQLIQPGGAVEQLTRKRHSSMSGGEKSAAIHLPLFAAANAIYSSADPACPRMIALDEAFAGIDGNFMPDLLGLTTKFDLDLFMTGHELWVTFPAVPMIAHYDMLHDKSSQTVSSLLILWDGRQLIDAGAGFGGNDEIARELLGFTPSRREPLTLRDNVMPLGATDEDDELGGGDEP